MPSLASVKVQSDFDNKIFVKLPKVFVTFSSTPCIRIPYLLRNSSEQPQPPAPTPHWLAADL